MFRKIHNFGKTNTNKINLVTYMIGNIDENQNVAKS